MAEAVALASLRARMIAHTAQQFFRSSKLRIAVIFALALSFWALMFCMFLKVFLFLGKFEAIRGIVIDYLFAFFFLALLAMMTISNGIISYTSLFRSDETSFLLSLPLPAETVFSYKSAESVVFSSWGMVTLVVPLILAYGLTSSVPWYFYMLSFALAVAFVFLPTELGALAALFVTVLMPRHKKTVLAASAIAALTAGFLWISPLLSYDADNIFSQAAIKSIIQKIAFCQHWALPSRWVSEGMLSAGNADPKRSVFLLLLLLSNVMFVGMIAHRTAHYLYPKAWAVAQGQGAKRKYAPFWWVDRIFESALFFLPARIKLLVLKDIKTFRRDPVQWSQCLLFFGLLALYIVNIPRFGFGRLGAYWHNLVSLLNLAATCLTLATFTSRFIYPQLSLEGRRMWIIGQRHRLAAHQRSPYRSERPDAPGAPMDHTGARGGDCVRLLRSERTCRGAGSGLSQPKNRQPLQDSEQLRRHTEPGVQHSLHHSQHRIDKRGAALPRDRRTERAGLRKEPGRCSRGGGGRERRRLFRADGLGDAGLQTHGVLTAAARGGAADLTALPCPTGPPKRPQTNDKQPIVGDR